MEKKEYKFWGWENADVSPITDEYKGINNPRSSFRKRGKEASLRVS